MDGLVTEVQLEICLNDLRTNPLKYQAAYSCDYDKDIAPKLVMGGRRLPLARGGTVSTAAADRLAFC
jgi:hypothetical protein